MSFPYLGHSGRRGLKVPASELSGMTQAEVEAFYAGVYAELDDYLNKTESSNENSRIAEDQAQLAV